MQAPREPPALQVAAWSAAEELGVRVRAAILQQLPETQARAGEAAGDSGCALHPSSRVLILH